ncbi:hypothetical protein F5883DRAFT_562538, partial [Diaporthe sp. PMI_573]
VESIPDSVPAPKRQRIAPGEPPAKQLERLLCSKKPSHDFNLLGTQQQQLLFSYLLGEYQHLRNYLHESHCPEADRGVVLHNRDCVERIRWCSFDLFRPSAPQQSLQLEVCTSGDERRKHAVEKSFFLHDAVSSQLLYYRLAVVFGMPEPVITDEYKTCWSVVLQFRDKTGRLELSDSKGGAWAAFCGSEDASKAALWFLGWIVSDQVPHTYDEIDFTYCDI